MTTDFEARANPAGTEYRDYAVTGLEVRADDERADFTFEGVASVVDTPYVVRDVFGEFEETIEAKAIEHALRDKGDVSLYINHRWDDIPLATRNSNTLTLKALPDLGVSATLDRQRDDAKRLRSAVTRGQMNQMSIGFRVPADKGSQTWNDDYTQRTIHRLTLKEVSVVKEGANPYTSASMRSIDDIVAALDNEDEIRRVIAHLESKLSPIPSFDASTYVVLRQQLAKKRLVA